MPTEEQVKACRDAYDRFYAFAGYGENDYMNGPWYVVDAHTEDASVGYPGDMVSGPHTTVEEARLAIARAVLIEVEKVSEQVTWTEQDVKYARSVLGLPLK